MHHTIPFNGWPNCIRLYNREIELIAATDVGPRIVKFSFINQRNLFHLLPDHAGKTGGEEWRIYGGHRLWLAPEAMPQSYNPDNEKVQFYIQGNTLLLIQPKERITGIQKQMEITLSPDRNEVTVVHRLTNQSSGAVTVAPWAISVLAQGGRAIIPQEPYGEGDEYLLPARPLALWHFTKMNDPRWVWGAKYIQARQDPAHPSEQKIGVMNKQKWTAYLLGEDVWIKKFDCELSAVYPDFGCNNETYINGQFLEIETLGPLVRLAPDEITEHTEHWMLAKARVGESEESIDDKLLPTVNSFDVIGKV